MEKCFQNYHWCDLVTHICLKEQTNFRLQTLNSCTLQAFLFQTMPYICYWLPVQVCQPLLQFGNFIFYHNNSYCVDMCLYMYCFEFTMQKIDKTISFMNMFLYDDKVKFKNYLHFDSLFIQSFV